MRRHRIGLRQAAAVLLLVVRVSLLLVLVEQRDHVQTVAVVHVAVAERVPDRHVPQYGPDHVAVPAQLAYDAPDIDRQGAHESGGRGRRSPQLFRAERVRCRLRLSGAAGAVHPGRRGAHQLVATVPQLLQQRPARFQRVVVVQRQ